LLSKLRQTLATDAIKRLVDVCFRKYPNGVVTNVQKGAVPSPYQSVARYVATYVVSPPIAVRRIDRYDGERVTYHDRSHRTERVEQETVDVITCIGRLVQHTLPKGFKRIRYDGVQATKTFAKVKVLIREALAKVEGVVKGAVKIIRPTDLPAAVCAEHGAASADLSALSQCNGGVAYLASDLRVIYDEGDVIQRGTYASSAQRAGP
jgi:hypothetical protein